MDAVFEEAIGVHVALRPRTPGTRRGRWWYSEGNSLFYFHLHLSVALIQADGGEDDDQRQQDDESSTCIPRHWRITPCVL